MKKQKISPERTQFQLLQAGMHLFGLNGFKGTRTRELAQLAGVNQAAIPYHFGGKAGLYLAVAAYVVKRGRDQMKDEIEMIELKVKSGGLLKADAEHLLMNFFFGFMDNVILSEDLSDRSRFILREYSTPGAGFEIIYEGLIGKMHKLLCQLVGIIEGNPPESERVILKTHVLFGTVIGNALTRNLLFRRLDWDDFTPERIGRMKQTIAEIVCHGLRLDDPQKYLETS
ncbi:CerR family C-terminal domain-containing protein [Pseudodesulfovibrio nedwellii]|nr:CerR family C-terminal domain-containing protein [Pseudodesulfovibrio nedwellii]